MGQALILVGGAAWIVVVLTLLGYSSVLAGARRWESAAIGFACALLIITMGVIAIQNAPYLAATYVWN